MGRATKGMAAAILGIGLVTIGARAPAAQTATTPAKPATQKPPTSKPEPSADAKTAAAGQDLRVTVTYKGKGTVSKANELSVFLFDTPNIGAGSTPIAFKVLEKNGGTAVFTGVTATPVYVAVAYDEKGNFEPGQGPPPPGTPVAIHGVPQAGSAGVTATPVKPGKGAKVAITFDDSNRMKS